MVANAATDWAQRPFQCSSASRKFLNPDESGTAGEEVGVFQCSSASRKFLNSACNPPHAPARAVSVLFSEPKIPQLYVFVWLALAAGGFSALQRAENSSIRLDDCALVAPVGFSALQRAENSSIDLKQIHDAAEHAFQCSSASRKFLNSCMISPIPRLAGVSVLFSEPKIPQSPGGRASAPAGGRFSALQRAENSSIGLGARGYWSPARFSALQRAENSSISPCATPVRA